jgi:hypothetical protein
MTQMIATETEHVMPLTSLIIRIEARLARTDTPQSAPTREALVEVRADELDGNHLGKIVYLDDGTTRGRITHIERRRDLAAAGGYAVDIVVAGELSARTNPRATAVQVLETLDVPIREGLAAAEGWAEYLAVRGAEDRLLCVLGRVEGEQILARMRCRESAGDVSTADALQAAAAQALAAYQAELQGLGMPAEKIAAASLRMVSEMQAEIANL